MSRVNVDARVVHLELEAWTVTYRSVQTTKGSCSPVKIRSDSAFLEEYLCSVGDPGRTKPSP
jgi:hypothetical protein